MNILDRILECKRREVVGSKKRTPLRSLLRERIAESRDFAAAIGGRGISLIAEVKRKAPSGGVIRERCDVSDVARMYEHHGAAAISVLTDKEFFGGSLDDLLNVKVHCGLPVLRKDFIIDEYQLYESAVYGADAVLLIAAILSTDMLTGFLQLAEGLGMACLVEVHSDADLSKAVASGGKIVGINNRDLETFDVDIGRSLRLRGSIPPGCISVSESGIRTASDIERLREMAFDAALVGTALMDSSAPDNLLEDLVRSG